VDLSLASKDANVSFLQQVTIERPKSNGCSQSVPDLQLADSNSGSWPNPGIRGGQL
jgi:hypothetical protein